NAVRIREGDADRFQDADFSNRQALLVSREAFERVQAGTKEKLVTVPPRLPKEAPVLDRHYARQKDEDLKRDYIKITNDSELEKFKVGDVVQTRTFNEVVENEQSEISRLQDEAQQLKEKNDALGARRREEEATRLKQLLPEKTEPTPMEGVVQFE